ncbi:DUF1707 domain-containing protein [Mycolicibacterium moriokaense]|nr:DUF1707 domain-containing protein [Mycolicibacterium moriokaense]
MTRVRRPRERGGVTGHVPPVASPSVCDDTRRTLTIFDVATPRFPGTRAKDSDRTATCQVLDSALGEGQLSMEEHRQRVSAAVNATTLGELQSLVTDLQPVTSAPPGTQRSPLRRRPLVIAAGAGGAAIIAGAIAWALTSGGSTPSNTAAPSSSTQPPEPHALTAVPSATSTTVATPDDPTPVVLAPPTNLLTADGIAGVLDEMRKRFGDSMGYELAIMPDQAMLARPDPSDDSAKLVYTFKVGWSDPSPRSRSDTDDLTDLGAFDVPAAAAALQAAPDTLRIAPDDVAETVIDVDQIADPGGQAALELLVKVTTHSGADGFVYLDSASNVKRVEYPS